MATYDVGVRYLTGDGEVVVTKLAEVDSRRFAHGSPVRRPSSHRGSRHYPGLFWLATNQAHVVYESRLELDRLLLADFDSAVARIAAQPLWSGVDWAGDAPALCPGSTAPESSDTCSSAGTQTWS